MEHDEPDPSENEINPYDLEPVDESVPAGPQRAMPVVGVPCAGCGYALDGLAGDGVCPECGMPIRRSMAGDLLRDSSPLYVESLKLGALLVYVGIIASVGFTVLSVLAGILMLTLGGMSGSTSPPSWLGSHSFQVLSSLAGVGVSFVGLFGWWKLSSPDPRHGSQQQGLARRILRVCVVVLACSAIVTLVLQVFSSAPVGAVTPIMVLAMLWGFVHFAAWIAMFVSAMLYLKGLAPRIPDPFVTHRAQMYVWLLPLIYILGACVLWLGPLIALLMYALLIHRVHADLKGVLQERRLLDAAGLG